MRIFFFVTSRHNVKWSSFTHLLAVKQVEGVNIHSVPPCAYRAHAHTQRENQREKKEHYLLVFILQGDLILAGSLSLGPLHFLSTTGGRSILQAQHLSAAMEMRGQTAISPPYWPSKLCSVIAAASHQLCGVWGGSRGKKQVESNVWLWWLGGKDDWIYVPGPIWSDLLLHCRLQESNSGQVTRIKMPLFNGWHPKAFLTSFPFFYIFKCIPTSPSGLQPYLNYQLICQ